MMILRPELKPMRYATCRVGQGLMTWGGNMTLVKHILDTKGRDVISIEPGASVLDAIRLMAEKSIGALLVMEDDRLLGILSERD